MDGVKFISVGRDPTARRSALVGCSLRIRRASQPPVFIHNGSRLGARGRRSPVEHLERKGLGELGDPHIDQPLACGILDRAVFLSIGKSQPVFCTQRINAAADPDGDHYIQPEYKDLFYKKRGT